MTARQPTGNQLQVVNLNCRVQPFWLLHSGQAADEILHLHSYCKEEFSEELSASRVTSIPQTPPQLIGYFKK